MSDCDSDNENENSTVELVPAGGSSSLRDKLQHHIPRTHRRSSEVTPVIGGGFAKPPARRVNSGGSFASSADVDHHHHGVAGGHHRPLRSTDEESTVVEPTVAHHLDTISEDASRPTSPTSPVQACRFVVGSSSSQVDDEENPLVANVREQLARDLRGRDGGNSLVRQADSCEMKILDLLSRSEPRNNNGDLAIDPNAPTSKTAR